ncbi:aldose epimerase family protein [Lentisphaerota bacterium WC36G]|nr:galactose mutarotase [Lentisphaerae bacterium WC36]
MSKANITINEFGFTKDGENIELFTLKNSNKMEVAIINYGAAIQRVSTPDKDGNFDDIILGFNTVAEYEADGSSQGAVVGRVGNRIAFGKFTLNGVEYTLPQNNDPAGIPCCLHGGIKGFDWVVWEAEAHIIDGQPTLTLSYLSEDGEEGFPGNLTVLIHYTLTDDNTLTVEYHAISDKDTPINLTNHGYFNLKGEGAGSVYDHELQIYFDQYTPVNTGLIPTGEIHSVENTPYDFTTMEKIGTRIEDDFEQLEIGAGYDMFYYCGSDDKTLKQAADVYEPTTGRTMSIWTTEPGVQFYSANFLDGAIGKNGQPHLRREAFCLETQHAPDSVNQPNFPSTILKADEEFYSRTDYVFGVK